MREILFRGKTETEKWVYGALDNTLNWADFIIVHENGFGIKNRILPETVGQFTGLTDKNGTKIFEGDIITALGKNYSICYHEAGFYLEGKNVMYRMTEKILKDEKSQVIGNIHDNPELLK